jgi:hypothetical protein
MEKELKELLIKWQKREEAISTSESKVAIIRRLQLLQCMLELKHAIRKARKD